MGTLYVAVALVLSTALYFEMKHQQKDKQQAVKNDKD